MTEKRYPKVGVGVIIKKNNSVLMGIRKSNFGKDQLSLPGGHVEMFEPSHIAARREVFEECNLLVTNLTLIGFTEDIYTDLDKHYITIFYMAECSDKDPIENEPDKIGEWRWIPIESLKELQDQIWLPCIDKFQKLGWM